MSATLDQETLAIYKGVVDNPKVPMTLRVGIAGPRRLNAQDTEQVTSSLREVLSTITTTLNNFIAQESIARRLYDTDNHPRPVIRLTTSLANGSDRLIMAPQVITGIESAAKVEYAAILPFLPADCEAVYEADATALAITPPAWQAFPALLEQVQSQAVPRIIALDGDAGTEGTRDQAYYRCAEYLTDNIDLLLAITPYNQQTTPSQHKAGTQANIEMARKAGKPVIQIQLQQAGSPPDIIVHQARRVGHPPESQSSSAQSMERMLSRLVLFGNLFQLPDAIGSEDESGAVSPEDLLQRQTRILEEFENHIHDKVRLQVDAGRTPDYDYSGPIHSPISARETWRGFVAFNWFKQIISSRRGIEQNKNKLKISDGVTDCEDPGFNRHYPDNQADAFFAHFLRADALAVRYASIHRSTYFLIYVLAASALITAASALNFQIYKPLVTVLMAVEALLLVLIYKLYKQDHHNHHKWLQNRCLAEAIRPNIYLNGLGRSFSFIDARSSDEFMYREVLGHQESGAQWVCMQAELIIRHLGFRSCVYHPDFQKKAIGFLKKRWLCGQIQYHHDNAATMQSIGERLSKSTHALFFLTATALAVKGMFFFAENSFGLPVSDTPLTYLLYKFSSLLTAVFPILGTAIFAIRNHSELDISAQRSRTMLAFFNGVFNNLTAKTRELFSADRHTPGNSAVIDSDLQRLTEVSAREVSDWLEIYEVKESEPG